MTIGIAYAHYPVFFRHPDGFKVQIMRYEPYVILISDIRLQEENRQLLVTYHKFGQEESYTIPVDPYAIKVFRQRWYLLAKTDKRGTPCVYALDRMEDVEEFYTHFSLPADFSVKKFFQDCYGVLHDPKCEAQQIIIRAYYPYADYLRTLPLHSSQTELENTLEYADFELRLRPTFDFKQEVLAQAHEVEVLEPGHLREEMTELLAKAMKRYGFVPVAENPENVKIGGKI